MDKRFLEVSDSSETTHTLDAYDHLNSVSISILLVRYTGYQAHSCLTSTQEHLKGFAQHTNSVPLRTGTCYIKDIFVLFLQDYCAQQELLMKMNFTTAVAPPFVHPMTSLPATPTYSVRKYGFFSEPTRRRQVAKYCNLKRCESLSLSGDIESLEPSKF